eukprot:TRINITY_DN6879_c0_g1_i1.p1 TRINITY_DN6879_c0_g1~~TRINITY_DN6879_c0_g1_i1.p1  ORF type:complete len:62 (-),score=9.79 TRINITY_DN6879_c0_g1_i1:109-294(-)
MRQKFGSKKNVVGNYVPSTPTKNHVNFVTKQQTRKRKDLVEKTFFFTHRLNKKQLDTKKTP